MKNRNKQLRVGLVPTRREAFANETTTKQKKAIVERFRRLVAELDFEMVDIEDINEEGMLLILAIRRARNAFTTFAAARKSASSSLRISLSSSQFSMYEKVTP